MLKYKLSHWLKSFYNRTFCKSARCDFEHICYENRWEKKPKKQTKQPRNQNQITVSPVARIVTQ